LSSPVCTQDAGHKLLNNNNRKIVTLPEKKPRIQITHTHTHTFIKEGPKLLRGQRYEMQWMRREVKGV